MREPSLPRPAAMNLPFRHGGAAGSVRVWYGTNRRPSDGGFAALRGWSREERAGVGFPVIKCEITTGVVGYWNFLGWIQYVTQDPLDGARIVPVVDRVPSMVDRDVPFAITGYCPTFFDAPAHNRLPVIDWQARLFLCTQPIMSRKEPIVPLVGLRWGYRIEESGEPPMVHPLAVATEADWRTARQELTRRHPQWRFAARLGASIRRR